MFCLVRFVLLGTSHFSSFVTFSFPQQVVLAVYQMFCHFCHFVTFLTLSLSGCAGSLSNAPSCSPRSGEQLLHQYSSNISSPRFGCQILRPAQECPLCSSLRKQECCEFLTFLQYLTLLMLSSGGTRSSQNCVILENHLHRNAIICDLIWGLTKLDRS